MRTPEFNQAFDRFREASLLMDAARVLGLRRKSLPPAQEETQGQYYALMILLLEKSVQECVQLGLYELARFHPELFQDLPLPPSKT